ncbi:hypothetical protein [Allobranchiibius huperziae]|uniref:Toxin-antitoxin system HicB family antitoxin n=1 Tax=Allobranchiibius huperziae TaxID=1874116 RepID=A0A853DEX5_9MICO|nr:hypothetical protein [Allobranchiibius huperziae]NYJ75227.1 hypothetical protein [Allobranchiibius huperziae]
MSDSDPPSEGATADSGDPGDPGAQRPPARRSLLLRLDPAVHEALTRLAQDELRSVNAEVEMLIREALRKRGRLPKAARPLPRRGRPRSDGG